MPRYPLIHRLLHWTIAVIAPLVLTVGMIFMFLEFEGTLAAFGQPATDLLYTYHKTFGIVILTLMLLRLVIRLTFGKPEYRPPIAGWERAVSTAVHASLYALLILQPMLGWAATAAGGFPVQFFAWTLPGLLAKDEGLSRTLYDVHGLTGWLILLLVVVHIAGALRHWLVKRDQVMTRMALP
jgi:cytochrome b561